MLPRTLPLAVLAISLLMTWSEWQLVNSLRGLVPLEVAVDLPFTPITIWLPHGFVLQVPMELEEAAAIDGRGPVGVFSRAMLPLMTPGLPAGLPLHLRHRLE